MKCLMFGIVLSGFLIISIFNGCTSTKPVPLTAPGLRWAGPAPWDETAAKFNVRPEQISRGGE
jgi:hypothetical protein